ncbi:glycosyltransferase [Variovorax sp. CCNWLW235]|uniref:glycosyltransferase n=1 Tax=Variovorax sp. CCNWLW235 TaxID=3127463 RepID=UPI0030779E7E
MRIVIDLQGAQSVGSRTRGIGRYSSSLARAMAARAGEHEIVLALNGYFADAVDDIRTTFDGVVDPGNLRVWYPAPGLTNTSGQGAQGKLYEAFLWSLQPDAVHVSSLFEGLGDPSVTSIGEFAAMPTAVTLYDLIPLINPHPYLDNARVRSWYMGKVAALQRANMWLAISESSRQEGITHLGLDVDRCINISTAAYGHFRKLTVSAERLQELRERYGLRKAFIMYTGGIDHRKNLEGLIEAFALLPGDLRHGHQLAIVCSARDSDRNRLLQLARDLRLSDGDVAMTGFVPEADLVDLYNCCRLFVFPSWHEGFGLPALEAMQCGAAVIGANTSSLPEVIGREDALFDPRSASSIAEKIARALTDQAFHDDLARHGLVQARKFSWEESARRALAGLEALHAPAAPRIAQQQPPPRRLPRPRLAYVSPLPPERSGIADYSALLLPELSRYYEIDLIAKLPDIDEPSIAGKFALRSVDWFRQNSGAFDRVLYHFGNSHFHEHMFELIAEIPGTVVLHDFFLGNIQAYREFVSGHANRWTRALYDSHGYPAVAEHFSAQDPEAASFKYPCNLDVLRHAQGVIVHSPHSMQLAQEWIGNAAAADWALIPLLRTLPTADSGRRAEARAALGLEESDILVCSFGMLNPTKLNHRLLQSWQASSLAGDLRCKLVFVGDNEKGAYGARLELDVAATQGQAGITGWVDKELFHCYLSACDIAVQLRTLSRGETSAAVLDAMGHAAATITNANGSMAFLPREAVWMLPDDFTDAQLIEALEQLRNSPSIRRGYAATARELVRDTHSPQRCAREYADAIERFAVKATHGRGGLIRAIGTRDRLDAAALGEMAQSIAATLPLPAARQLLVDVSAAMKESRNDNQQIADRSLLRALFATPRKGCRVEPIHTAPGMPGYKYARQFALEVLDCPPASLADAWIDARPGDVFLGLEFPLPVAREQREFLRRLRHLGVRVEFMIHELPKGPGLGDGLSGDQLQWLKTLGESDGAICTTQAVADELAGWFDRHEGARKMGRFRIRACQPGAGHPIETAVRALCTANRTSPEHRSESSGPGGSGGSGA